MGEREGLTQPLHGPRPPGTLRASKSAPSRFVEPFEASHPPSPPLTKNPRRHIDQRGFYLVYGGEGGIDSAPPWASPSGHASRVQIGSQPICRTLRGFSPSLSPTHEKPPSPHRPTGVLFSMAEREGFEPSDPQGSTVFKTAAFDRSATSPGKPRSIAKGGRQGNSCQTTTLK